MRFVDMSRWVRDTKYCMLSGNSVSLLRDMSKYSSFAQSPRDLGKNWNKFECIRRFFSMRQLPICSGRLSRLLLERSKRCRLVSEDMLSGRDSSRLVFNSRICKLAICWMSTGKVLRRFSESRNIFVSDSQYRKSFPGKDSKMLCDKSAETT